MSALVGYITAIVVSALAIFGIHAEPATPWQASPEQAGGQQQTATDTSTFGHVDATDSNPNLQTVAVVGMTKYTDSDFGFSFWYPTSWTFSTVPIQIQDSFVDGRIQLINGESVTKEFLLSDGNEDSEVRIFEINSPDRSFYAAGNGKWSGTKYYFDTNMHTWMVAHTDIPSATNGLPADVSQNGMGGLHVFTHNFQVVVPLSAQHFVVVDTNFLNTSYATQIKALAQTIVATDATVGTPVSDAEQITFIQAEKGAFLGL
jgi:hypothetical protein